MKDQYFGDVNDFRKYGLLRALAVSEGFRLGVCWMLTDGDSRADGNLLSYLGKSAEYRHRDTELFDWLKQVIETEKDRRTVRIERSKLLGAAVFQSKILADRYSDRKEYFQDSARLFAGCDLVFFDPDNGFEIGSRPLGRKNSSKHIYWEEVAETFRSGTSVLIYQHFIREKRADYVARITQQLRSCTGAAAVFSFRTPHVLFVLAAQERHVSFFRARLSVIESGWRRHIAVVDSSLQELPCQTTLETGNR